MQVDMQILDCDYVMLNNKPLVRLFGKTAEGEAVCALTNKTLPYFYIDTKEEAAQAKAAAEKEMGAQAEVVEKILPIGYRQPKNILKITGRDPGAVPEMKEKARKFGTPYEADILFKYRYLVDNGLKGMSWVRVNGKPAFTKTVKCKAVDAETIEPVQNAEQKTNAPLRCLSLDIESVSASDDRVAEAEKDGIAIISLCFFPDYRSSRTMVLSAKPVKTGNDVVACADEKEMLKKLVEIINDYDPDIITGYNINNFDMPFIVKRLEVLNLPRDFGRSEKQVFCRKLQNGHSCPISGRVVVDPYEIIKKDPWVKFRRYDLGTIAKAMLGEGKMEMGGIREMRGLWEGSREQMKKFIDYSRLDAELAMRLVIEKGLLDKFFELAKISGLLLQDALGGQSQRHECKLLHEFRRRGIIMPCKPEGSEMKKFEDEREDRGLKGAIVLEPIAGLHKDSSILVLDFTSLYPSLIRTYNICPTTLLLDAEQAKQAEHFTTPQGVKFVKHDVREGVLPAVLRELMEARAAAKKQMKAATAEQKRLLNAKQLALKDMANSLYGYTGYMRARLYVMDVANSVTAYGRENIIKTKKLIEDNFKKTVVYGDSITADRFVTVMKKDGMVEIKNIEELFLENKDKAEFARGKEFINLESYKALTVYPGTEAEWMPIKQIIRHKTDKKIFRVNQKFGEAVVTEDHSIITNSLGRLEETRPQDMNNKEMVRVKNIPKPKQIDFIDLYEILSRYKTKSIYKKREKTSSVREEDGWLTFGWTNRKNQVKIKKIIKANSEEFESLCRLVGAYIAEGSSSTTETTKSRDGASIAASDIKWLEQLKEDYLKIFRNAEVSIIKTTKKKRTLKYRNSTGEKTIEYEDGTHKLQMMNRLSAVFFKTLCGQKSYGKKIPEFVYHIPEKYQKIVLENMIKGDGSHLFMNMKLNYSEIYKQNNFRYETRSLHLASGLSFLLSLLGQNYTIRYRPAKKTYILTTTTKNNLNTPTKITEEKYDGYVYDLSVEGSHMFVDGCGQILLHNTDSIFVKTDTTNLDEAEKEGVAISSFVTEELPGILDLKFEKIYKTFLILTKKRYAGWKFEKEGAGWKDKVEMKGIETVRRDWCSLTSETMLNVLNIILKEGDIQKAAKFVRAVIEDLSAGKIPLEKLTIIKGVSRALGSYKGVQPHVELAKKIGKRDPTKAVIVGERLGYVIVKGNQLVSKRAEDPEYVKEKGLEIDPQYYIENQMLPPLERIFDVCGVQKSELVEGSHQKKLFELFGAKAEIKSPELTVLKGFDSVVCRKCDWSFRRVPLAGKCPKCGSGLWFQKDGSVGATVEM